MHGDNCWNVHDARDAKKGAAPTSGSKRKVTFDETVTKVSSEKKVLYAAIVKKTGDDYLLQTQDGREYLLKESDVAKWRDPSEDEDDENDDSASSSESQSESDEGGPFWICKCGSECDDDARRCDDCKRKRPPRARRYERQHCHVWKLRRGK